MKQLILGGARSGKSRLAEQLAGATGNPVVCIVTADSQKNDDEMAVRIERHRRQRPDHWQTLEAPRHLAGAIQEADAAGTCLLVDCLTLWLSNCLHDHGMDCWLQEREQLLRALPDLRADILLIGNELGSGLVPLGAGNRSFVDQNGFLHQSLASLCERVILTAAGLPLVLKGAPLP